MYVVYAIKLDDYTGRSLSPSQALLKVGVSFQDVWYRLDANERFEGRNSYRALFRNIEVIAQKEFWTKEQAEAYEAELHQSLGQKDCSIYEKVKGVTELRQWTLERENWLRESLS